MSVDETRWPGPSWDFTVHKGFPSFRIAGDVYVNFSGGVYLYDGKEYKPLSIFYAYRLDEELGREIERLLEDDKRRGKRNPKRNTSRSRRDGVAQGPKKATDSTRMPNLRGEYRKPS